MSWWPVWCFSERIPLVGTSWKWCPRYAGQGTQWIWQSLVWWGEESFPIRSHSPRPHHHSLLCASLCFLTGPVQLFLRPLRERGEGIYLARARQQCTAAQRWEWSRESVGRNPIDSYPCQNSPSGSTILSSRALGRGRGARVRVKMKDSVPCSFTEPRACCKTAESSILCVAAPAQAMNWI